MARLQWCRKHIKEVAEACDLSPKTVKDVERAGTFCDNHGEFSPLPSAPILALIRVPDEQVRERAIIKCKERLIGKIGAGRGNTKDLTEKEIKKIIEDTEIEVRNEEIEKIRAEEEAEEQRTGIKNITQEEVDKLMGVTEDPMKDPEPVINKQGNRVYTKVEVEKIRSETPPHIKVSTIMQFEIDLYFEVMNKILCIEDIPKHRKKIKMMIENQTLLIVG